MARTKKTDEMEQKITTADEILEAESTKEEESFISTSVSEAPILLDELETDDFLSDDRESFQLTENESILELDINSSIPSDTHELLHEVQSQKESAKGTKNPDSLLGAYIEKTVDLEPKKKKRAVKSKKEDTVTAEKNSGNETEKGTFDAAMVEPAGQTVRRRAATPAVLTIESGTEVETPEDREDIIWHEIHNAYRTRKILTGTLGGIEQLETGKTIAIVYYKEMRIIIPMKEMMINLPQENMNYGEMMLRQNKILGTMLGADVDFIVKGIDSKARSVVASRKDAMLKKRQLFYMNSDTDGMHRIHENRVVQARVIAVADKVIRVEIFGVECSIMARDLTWDWLGDAHERFNVGDQILVRILSVIRDSLEDIAVKADVKSVTNNTGRENLNKCRVQGKYAGKVTDIHKGTVFVRLSIGVNAVAHSCYDNRMPGKKDDVSFVVTHLDEERGVAVGIITRIIKQNF